MIENKEIKHTDKQDRKENSLSKVNSMYSKGLNQKETAQELCKSIYSK